MTCHEVLTHAYAGRAVIDNQTAQARAQDIQSAKQAFEEAKQTLEDKSKSQGLQNMIQGPFTLSVPSRVVGAVPVCDAMLNHPLKFGSIARSKVKSLAA